MGTLEQVSGRIEAWVPDGLSEERGRQARISLWMALLISPWSLIIGGMILATGSLVAGSAILATGLACAAVPLIVWNSGRVELASHLLVGSLLQALVVAALMLGGGATPPTAWIAIVPVVATATGGLRAGAIWTFLSMASAVALFFAHMGGLVVEPYLTDEWIVIGMVSMMGLYFCVGVILRANDLVYRELLERLRTAEAAAREANRAKSDVLANMSHEIRTPLNAILGYTELVMEDAEDAGNDAVVDDLDRVRRSGTHLLELVNDILDLSKIEAGRFELALEQVDVEPMVRALAEELAPLVEAQGNTLELELVPFTVRADRARLRQTLLNLLSNAIKFTEHGRVSVHGELDGQTGRIAVSDTGIGMTPSQVERLFEPFSQASPEIANQYGGTGLGMSIAHRLVHLMEGRLEAESESGTGTTVTLHLPLAEG